MKSQGHSRSMALIYCPECFASRGISSPERAEGKRGSTRALADRETQRVSLP